MLNVVVRWVGKSTATLISCVLAATFAVSAFAFSANTKDSASRYLDQIGVRRGICVVLASEPAELALELAERSELTLYVQHPNNERVDNVRRAVDEAGLLGTRIYVEKGAWSHIHLADNLADAVIVTDQAAAPLATVNEELNRVVRPLGKVVVGKHVSTKPYPDEADDWTHPYHGPDNNPQSTDHLARCTLHHAIYGRARTMCHFPR